MCEIVPSTEHRRGAEPAAVCGTSPPPRLISGGAGALCSAACTLSFAIMLCHCSGDRGAAGPASSLSCRVQLIGISQRWSVLFMSPSRTGSAGPSQGTVPVLERCRRGCSRSPSPGSARCIYSAFRGCCRSPAATREIFLFPLCCITWLLFSCCCFFPPAFVDVGCGQGQVTGQDVLLLRRYRHVNK